jgi:Helix-turn-helix domain
MSETRAQPDDVERPIEPAVAADILGVTVKTLANWRWKGEGPEYVRYGGPGKGGSIRYFPSVVLAYRNARRRRSTSEAPA